MNRLITQLPPLEITSCQFCDNLIPLNMFRMHQVVIFSNIKLFSFTVVFITKNTCSKSSPWLSNEFYTPLTDNCM